MRACEHCFIALPTSATNSVCTDCADHVKPARPAPVEPPRRLRIIHSAMTVKHDRGLERIAV